ncbi:MAG: M1 family metallopeptidase [Planctomycetota bacterium]
MSILAVCAAVALAPHPTTGRAVAPTFAAPVARAADQDSGGALLPEQAAFDVLHYALDVTVEPGRRRIDGRLVMRAKLLSRTDSLVLQLDDALEVAKVELDGREVEAVHDDGLIRFASGELVVGSEFEVAVTYGGAPVVARNPPWDGGFTWSRSKDGSPWIATSCQGEGADLWWPCKDHPSDEPDGMDIAVTVPDPLVVATNGRFVGKQRSTDGFTKWIWKVTTPINNYGVALAIGNYVTLTTQYQGPYADDPSDTFPFTFWVLPEEKQRAERVFEEFQKHMYVMEELCGPYPFRGDKYGVVHVPFLGMEHQSIIAYGSGFGNDPWNRMAYDSLHQHELSHEWWGNLVTCSDWSDFWIHEGIGTYMQALYLERTSGKDNYFAKMKFDRGSLANRGAVAPRGPKSSKWMYFANREGSPGGDIYNKGSWICHTLRHLLGDETFFEVLRRWAYPDPALERTTDGSACRLTSTDELLAIAERTSGEELEWFFHVYLRQPLLPKLEHEVEDGVLDLRWVVPDDLPFPMPVEVQVGDERVRIAMTDGKGRLEVGDAKVVVDPDDWILRANQGR